MTDNLFRIVERLPVKFKSRLRAMQLLALSAFRRRRDCNPVVIFNRHMELLEDLAALKIITFEEQGFDYGKYRDLCRTLDSEDTDVA